MKRLALLLALLPLPAAAMDFGDYMVALQTDDGRAAVRTYLQGFGDAAGMAEAYQATFGGGARRFCPPKGTPLNPELLAGLVGKVVNDSPQLAKKEMPVASLIVIGLERQFPCARRTPG